jgi:O-antigen ligase/tetratricopeptide (TPR) repeat protein
VLAIVAMPLAMGGRHPLGQVILTAAAIAATVSWTIRACRGDGVWRFNALDALAIAGMASVAIQVVPLPRTWIETISPRLFSLLPCLDGGPRSVGGWDQLSLAPGETLACLGILIAQAVFAAVLVQRIRSVADVERVLGAVAGAMGILAAVGIVQYLAGNGRYLWIYEFAHNDAGGAVKGTFTNRNHFAGFLAIGCGTVLVRATAGAAGVRGGWNDRERLGGWLLVAVVGLATILSLSRGGCLAAAVASVVALGCLARSAAWRVSSVVGAVTAVGLVAVAVGIHGWDRLMGRFEVLGSGFAAGGGLERLAVWRAAIRSISEFPWLGTGAGSHAEVAPLAMPSTAGIVFTHAENGFLNVGVETGLIGLAVVLFAIGVAIVTACRLVAHGGEPERRAGAAVASGLAAGVLHALADFTWYVPACSTLLVTLGGCGVALASRRAGWLPTIDLALGRHAAGIAGCGVAVLLCGTAARQIAAARAEPFWEDSVKLAREIEASASGLSSPAYGGAPEAAAPLLTKLDARIASLERCVSLRPDHPRARAALALARLDRFGLSRLAAGKSLGLVDLRLAVDKGGFASPADVLAWVHRAAAPAAADLELALDDAAAAIRISPLSGQSWCALSQLVFLVGRPEASRDFIAQAMLVRPSDALVLFEAANQSALDGDTARANELWRASFAADSRQRARIIKLLLPRLTSSEACDLLEPDLDGLRAIEAAWAVRETAADLEEVRSRRLERAVATAEEWRAQPSTASRLLLEAGMLEQRLGRPSEALVTFQSAVRTDPSSFDAHRLLADTAIAVEDWSIARRELEWCLLRRPDRGDLREKLGNLRGRRDGVVQASDTAPVETTWR